MHHWFWLVCHWKLKESLHILYKFWCFLFTRKTGELYPVRLFLISPFSCSWFISFSITSFVPPWLQMYKQQMVQCTSNSGHIPILSCNLKHHGVLSNYKLKFLLFSQFWVLDIYFPFMISISDIFCLCHLYLTVDIDHLLLPCLFYQHMCWPLLLCGEVYLLSHQLFQRVWR